MGRSKRNVPPTEPRYPRQSATGPDPEEDLRTGTVQVSLFLEIPFADDKNPLWNMRREDGDIGPIMFYSNRTNRSPYHHRTLPVMTVNEGQTERHGPKTPIKTQTFSSFFSSSLVSASAAGAAPPAAGPAETAAPPDGTCKRPGLIASVMSMAIENTRQHVRKLTC